MRGGGGGGGLFKLSRLFLASFLFIYFSFLAGRGGGGFSSATIFNNLDTPHNLNAWNRPQTYIHFITLHTLFCFTINIKQKYQWFIISFIRCL